MKNGTLSQDSASWAELMNMVWIDSPAGVGFSTARTRYVPNDARTASDAYAFIVSFLAIFPELSTRPIYITGESYAGHYIPNLVSYILNENAAGAQPQLNLAGFMAGNPWTVPSVDNEGAVEFWSTHGIITEAHGNQLLTSCDFSNIGPLKRKASAAAAGGGSVGGATAHTRVRRLPMATGAVADAAKDPAECQSVLAAAQANFAAVDIYDVYTDVCVGEPTIPPLLAAYIANRTNGTIPPRNGPRSAADALWQKLYAPAGQPADAACVDYWVSWYLNDPHVQAAIHAPIMPWHTCSDDISTNYDPGSVLSSVIPKYQQAIAYANDNPSFKILVYSGDVDGILPFLGTRRWVESLAAANRTTAHTPWLAANQTAGFVSSYFGGQFVFTTIRGAGHMVPGTQPFRAYEMVRRFLDGTLAQGM